MYNNNEISNYFKDLCNKNFGLGINSKENLAKKFGIKNFQFLKFRSIHKKVTHSVSKITFLVEQITTFLNLNIPSRELCKRNLYLNFINTLKIGCVQSYRKYRGLPTHGQRTRTNAKIVKNIKYF